MSRQISHDSSFFMWLDEELDDHPSSIRPPSLLPSGSFPHSLFLMWMYVDPGLDKVLTSSPYNPNYFKAALVAVDLAVPITLAKSVELARNSSLISQ